MINYLFQAAESTTDDRGFTLLELLVVSILIAIMLSLSVPAFRTSLVTDQLRQAARRVIGTVNEARQEAARSANGCNLDLDISENQLSYDCPEPAGQDESAASSGDEKPLNITELPPTVRISSVWSGADQNVTAGTITLWINKNGLMEQTIINLSDGDRDLALVSSVFVSTMRLEDKSMTPEDLEQY